MPYCVLLLGGTAKTINTQLFTWHKGVRVGEDDQGNIYYRTRDDKRRWVIFNGEAEASRINPEWHELAPSH